MLAKLHLNKEETQGFVRIVSLEKKKKKSNYKYELQSQVFTLDKISSVFMFHLWKYLIKLAVVREDFYRAEA